MIILNIFAKIRNTPLMNWQNDILPPKKSDDIASESIQGDNEFKCLGY